MYKLIAFDLDGTLINRKHTISRKTIKAIEDAKKQGVFITIATGRFFGSASAIAKKLRVNAPMIANDGAQIQDVFTGRVVSFTPIKRETCLKVAGILKNYPSVEVQFFSKNRKIYIGKNFKINQLKKYFRRKRFSIMGFVNYLRDFVLGPVVQVEAIDNIGSMLEDDVAKVVVSGDPSQIQRLKIQLQEELHDKITITSAIQNYIDILEKGVSKARGLHILAEELGIKRDEIVAVGDNFNDIDMIKYAGLGVAMGNAPEEVKRAARQVISNNDGDGIAMLIKSIIYEWKTQDFSGVRKSV